MAGIRKIEATLRVMIKDCTFGFLSKSISLGCLIYTSGPQANTAFCINLVFHPDI